MSINFLKKTGWLLFLSFFIFLCFFFRSSILLHTGNFLIREDSLQKADMIFVLGGDSYDRGNLAVELFKQGYSGKITCSGENIPTLLKALEISYTEAEITKINILSALASADSAETTEKEYKTALHPDSSVNILQKGTSTMEEITAIKDYCQEKKLNKIILITSKFHTRRVRLVCKKIFREEKPELIITGVPSSTYSEESWWKSEEGLIMVNNEYVKLIYYLLKY